MEKLQGIKTRIQGIQGSTADTVIQIEAISGVINPVNGNAEELATLADKLQQWVGRFKV